MLTSLNDVAAIESQLDVSATLSHDQMNAKTRVDTNKIDNRYILKPSYLRMRGKIDSTVNIKCR